MKYFVILLILIGFVSMIVTNPISAQCVYDLSQPHKSCDDEHGTLIIEPHQAQIENIDGKLFRVIGPFTLEQESDDRIRLDGVTFTYPSFPNPPTPGGPVSVNITFENGAKESIFKVGAPSPFIEFVGVDPQAGVRRNANGSFDYLLSFEQQIGFSLKQQIENNIDRHEIECPSEKQVLVLRPNEKLACVYFETADKLKWTTLEPVNGTYEIRKNNETFFVDYFMPEGKVIDISYDGYANSILIVPLIQNYNNLEFIGTCYV